MALFGSDRMLNVEYSNTKSINYQSVKAGIHFSVPMSVTLSEAADLARFLVDFEITGKYKPEDRQRLAGIYEQIFGEPLIAHIEKRTGKPAPLSLRKPSRSKAESGKRHNLKGVVR